MPNEDFLQLSVREFHRMKTLADKAVAQISPEAFATAPGPTDNSIALIIKHMSGNLRSRWTNFLNSDGEKPDRDRDAEFRFSPEDTRAALLAQWENGWSILFEAFGALKPNDLHRTVSIRGEPFSVLQAITRQLSHYSYHVGQIVYLAKHLAGKQWQSLSIPLGQSQDFNKAPKRYLK